jgi:hypothetical protein
VTNLISNPEFIRNVRSQLRPRKMMTAAAICALISISLGYLYARRGGPAAGPNGWATAFLEFALTTQALVLAAGGSIACLNSVYKEKEQNSFDYQRVTRLTPLELTLGKLFGAPILMYFVCLCLMPLSIFAAVMARSRVSFFLAAYAVLLVASVGFHALSLLISVLTIRGSQASAIILLLLLLWLSSIGGGPAGQGFFSLGRLSPFFASQLVKEEAWNVSRIKQVFVLQGRNFEYDRGMIDLLFGHEVHHAPVLIAVDAMLAFWFLLGIVRNIKRDPDAYELYSPAQSLAFAVFLNLLFLAFFRWRAAIPIDDEAYLLSINIGIFVLLSLALIRNRERMRRILRTRGGGPSWVDTLWPAPILILGTAGVGALIVSGAAWGRTLGQPWDARFALFRALFFVLWIVRDMQYLQWMSLRRGRNPSVMGVLYLSIYYVCSSTVLTAFGCFQGDRLAFSAFFLPSPVYGMDHEAWMQRPVIWAAAFVAQILVTALFLYLQGRKISELNSSADTPHLAAQAAM